ncbi:MAG: hypothetical protein Q9160_001602 [Pyrenula sp. 1 TL-2023]
MASPEGTFAYLGTLIALAAHIRRSFDYLRAAEDPNNTIQDLQTKVIEVSNVLGSLESTLEPPTAGEVRAGTNNRDPTNLLERVETSAAECEKTLRRVKEIVTMLRDRMPCFLYQGTRTALHSSQLASCPGSGISNGSCISPKIQNFGSKGYFVYAILITLSGRPLTIHELDEASFYSYETMVDLLPLIQKHELSTFGSVRRIVNKYLGSLACAPRLSHEDVTVSHSKQQLVDELKRLLPEKAWKSVGHGMIAIACMKTIAESLRVPAYNVDAHFGPHHQPRKKNESPLLAYSTAYWLHHCTNSNTQNQRLTRCIHGMIQSVFCAEKRHRHTRCNDITSTDLDRALAFAAKLDFCALGKTYIEMGANPHRRSSQHGETALHLAVAHSSIGMVRTLLEEGVDRNAVDGRGFTPLLWAAFFGQAAVVQQLVESGADVNAAQALGYSMKEPCYDLSFPLLDPAFQCLHADQNSVPDTEDCIFQMENNFNELLSRSSQAWTPLFIARFKGHDEVVKLLLQLGANDLSSGLPREETRRTMTKNRDCKPLNTNPCYGTDRRHALRTRVSRKALFEESPGLQRHSFCTSRLDLAAGKIKAKRNRKIGRRQPQKFESCTRGGIKQRRASSSKATLHN